MVTGTIELQDNFISNYSKIFDNDGNIKLCGREACKELIESARKVDSNTDFGNKNTGIMNVNTIKKLYNELIK